MKATCVINADHNDYIELLFPSTPDQETLFELKQAGFKWNSTRKMWYAKRSSRTFRLAQKLTSDDEPDLVGQIMDYEDGRMSNEEVVAFFQRLIDTGMAWTLQGSYGRMANELIEAGYCHIKRNKEVRNETHRK